MTRLHQYCTFYLHGQYFGLDVRWVQEIIRYQRMTRVPLAPPVVCGLINLRGQIVTVIDLRRRLGLPERPLEQQPVNVVVGTDDGAVSLLVDAIGDVVEVPEGAFENLPETLDERASDLILGAFGMKDRLLLILDINKIVTPVAGAAAPTRRAALKPPSSAAGRREHTS